MDATRLSTLLQAAFRDTDPGGGAWVVPDAAQLAVVAARVVAASMPCGEEKHPLAAYIWRRREEWVMEISGVINDTDFTVRHTAPITVAPEDVPGLNHLYAGRRETVVEELDFSDIPEKDRSKHPKIDGDHKYIILKNGKYHCGKMSPVWFGWNFYQTSGQGMPSAQFDPPGTNGCDVQKVWIVIEDNGLHDPEAILMSAGLDPVEIADMDELRYANERRQYCIDHKCTHHGVTITEESPIEAWLYKPTAERMPVPDEDEDEF